uniref:Uncharacterized protein n=1 Tax=Arundo donax TaxID=35708 RepID=A0A0A9GX91_ARUDO
MYLKSKVEQTTHFHIHLYKIFQLSLVVYWFIAKFVLWYAI